MSHQHEMCVQHHNRRDRMPSRRRASRRSLFASALAGSALLAITACSGAAPAAPSQPTVQAAATQVVGAAAAGASTAQAAASPVAATAMAAGSPAAATAIAGASPAAATMQAGAAPAAATAASVAGTAITGIPPLASPSPSPAAMASPLRIADASLSDATPWLSIKNDGDAPVDVGGWQLQVGSATAELPASAMVEPGGALTVHAGDGMSSDDEVYLGSSGDALASAAMPGAPVRLSDDNGMVVAEVTVPRF